MHRQQQNRHQRCRKSEKPVTWYRWQCRRRRSRIDVFDIPLPFAPSFYKIDLSEVPVLIGAFAMGPLAGAAIELIKILLNLVMKGSTTAGVGEVANFLIGCAYVMPAAWIYKTQKTKKMP